MKKLYKPLLFLAMLLLGGAVGYLVARYGLAAHSIRHLGKGKLLAVLALLPVAWLLAVLLHELGHALVGQRQGFRFRWLVVGPFMWKREADQLRFVWNKNLNLAGGLVLCQPPDATNLRRRFVAFALGGPLSSLAWAAVALGAYALLPTAASAVGQVLAVALAASGGISALLAVVTLIPMHVGGFYTDGGRAWHLWRGDAAGQLDLALITTLAHSMAGTRPRHLPLGLLEAAAALPQELPSKLYAHYYLYLAALDADRIEQAGQHLAAYRAQLPRQPAALQASGWLESAFFAAAYQHDLPAARAFRAQARPSALVTADVSARVEAALARGANDAGQALAQAQTALQALPRSIDQGSAHLYAEWLADTVRWAQAFPATPGSVAAAPGSRATAG